MNLYFLVEGKSELVIYRQWLTYLLPNLTRVNDFDQITDNNYYIFTCEGYPSMIDQDLPNAIEDVNSFNSNNARYDYLLVCLDADELAIEERKEEVYTSLQSIDLAGLKLVLIIQNRCLETWLLGNRNFVRMQLENQPDERRKPFLTYQQFYNVATSDPELMGVHDNFNTHSQFHEAYLKAVFKARGLSYTKGTSGEAGKDFYLKELIKRTQDEPNHLKSLQNLLNFCNMIKNYGFIGLEM